MWSWVLHRITGATIFFFLFVHVLDTALVRVSPRGLQRGHRHLQDADHRPDGDRAGRGGALPRAQRHPGHPDRLLAARPALPAADAVDRRRRLDRRAYRRARRASACTWRSGSYEPAAGEPVRPRQRARRAGAGACSAATTGPRAWTIRARRGAAAAMPNFEKYAWLFMRFSGVVLVFLALGHLFIG